MSVPFETLKLFFLNFNGLKGVTLVDFWEVINSNIRMLAVAFVEIKRIFRGHVVPNTSGIMQVACCLSLFYKETISFSPVFPLS